MLHLYIGTGKGKTTASMGLSLRGLAAGWRVVVVQFLKSMPSGEVKMLESLGATVLRAQPRTKFVWDMDEEEKLQARQDNDQLLQQALKLPAEMLILDEACGAVETSLLDELALRTAVERLAEQVEIVLTGRNPQPWMEELADYETEMRCLKHPYDRGVKARKGVEL